jgi:hypothetical protein
VVLGFELRALSLLGKCSTFEPCFQPHLEQPNLKNIFMVFLFCFVLFCFFGMCCFLLIAKKKKKTTKPTKTLFHITCGSLSKMFDHQIHYWEATAVMALVLTSGQQRAAC